MFPCTYVYGFETASHTRFFCDSFSCTFIALRFYRGFSQSFEFTFTVWTPSPFAANRECFRSNARRLPDLPTCGVRSPLLPRGGTHQTFAVKPKLGSDRHFCLFHGTFTLSSLNCEASQRPSPPECQRDLPASIVKGEIVYLVWSLVEWPFLREEAVVSLKRAEAVLL